jgi:hypothetical protein
LNQIKLLPPGTVAGGGAPVSLPAYLPYLWFKRQRRPPPLPPPPCASCRCRAPSPTSPCAPLPHPPRGTQRRMPPLLSLPATSTALKWPSSHPAHPLPFPFLLRANRESPLSHPHLHLVRRRSPESCHLAVLKLSTAVTSTTPVSSAPQPSSACFLCASPSPPPHLAAGTARGCRGLQEHPTIGEQHPNSPALHLTLAPRHQ